MTKLFILYILVITLMPLKTTAGAITEEQLKTVYIYNFMRFVQWPDTKFKEPIYRACTYPNNRFGKLLLQLEQRKITGKKIEVNELSLLTDIKKCHTVFLNNISKAELVKVKALADKHHVLTVSDQPQFADAGGMIQFFVEKGKIRFNINYYRSQKAKLEINSKLLSLAAHVIREDS